MDLVFERVSIAFGEKQVFDNFSHRFALGSATCITAPSGRGKTTLLRLAACLIAPDSGRVLGFDAQKKSAVFQEDRLFDNMTAEKNILLCARRGFTKKDVPALLTALGIDAGEARRPVASFSGGMRRRIAIARALAADFDLMLLDEPFAGLDAENRRRAAVLISRECAGRTLICATHDAEDADLLGAELLRI